MIKNIFFALLLSLCSATVYAQTGKQTIDMSSGKTKTAKQLFDIPVSVKASALEAVFGGQTVFAEFGLSDIFSIEAGVGINFTPLVDGNNNFYDANSSGLMQQFVFFGRSNLDDSEPYGFVPFSKLKKELGFHSSFMLKLMPAGEGDLTGGYYALRFRFTNLNYSSPAIVPGNYFGRSNFDYSNNQVATSVASFDGAFIYGYQFRIENVLIDLGLGFGLRMLNGKHNGYDSNGGYYQPIERDFKKTIVLYEAVFKVGYLLSE